MCTDLKVTSIFWRGNYVGKGTYHSQVLSVMKPLESGFELHVTAGYESVEDVRNPNKLSDPRSVGDRETWNHVDSVQVDKVATGIIVL